MLLFAHRLAGFLGRQDGDVDAMLAAMTPQQLNRWRAFEQIEPFGHPITDARHVMQCILASHGGKPASFAYHNPYRDNRPRPLTAEEIHAKVMVGAQGSSRGSKPVRRLQ